MKQKRFTKKEELKKIIETDTQEKKQFKDLRKQQDKADLDFSSHNVLSQIYIAKEHKAKSLARKNEEVVKLIEKNFQFNPDKKSYLQQAGSSCLEISDPKLVENKKLIQKQREMEIKKF